MPHIIILSIAVGAAAAGGGVLLAVDVLLSKSIDRQYELTPVKSTTVSLTTTPNSLLDDTSHPCFPSSDLGTLLFCCGTYSQGRGGLMLPENEWELDLARRNDVDSAK